MNNVQSEIKNFLTSGSRKLYFTSHYSSVVNYFTTSDNWSPTSNGGWINSNRTLVVSGKHPKYYLSYNY